MSMWVTPTSESASTTAFITDGSAPAQPASPQPLTPKRLVLHGTEWFSIEHHSVPCKTNLLGVKGCGEAGCAGALPSVMNAVVDALSEVGVSHIDMPVTPEKVWRALNGAR